MGEDAFYLPLGNDVYRATEHTVGPWSPDSQHMGPPSALLARQLERMVPEPDSVLARMTVEILGPVPVTDLAVRSWVERPGRSVRLMAAELSAGGRAVVRAWAWWLSGTDTTGVVAGLPDSLPPLASGTAAPRPEG
ncbi:MAG TPA: acyl-CoA thioesterase domain-containing protein, partial [Pseudonocardiaceae bacterium]|nr:acyl-CoA thioesterase domain-containing protein [Pseudonocardiaceae bacterium]